jgi:methylated-DNA-[protein]-cysteine S-methyltransferase
MSGKISFGMLDTKDLGGIGIAVSPKGLCALRMFQDSEEEFLLEMENAGLQDLVLGMEQTAPYFAQIERYLEGKLQTFSLPIDLSGKTDFQLRVLRATERIPYGETRSYGEIARAAGSPRAARAVGQAERSNPVPLIIPCHRVIGSDGSLTGYGGSQSTDTKAWLLEFERKNKSF